jgi:hypothetical protein
MIILPDFYSTPVRHRARGLHGLLAGRMGVFSLGSIGAGSCCCGGCMTTICVTGCAAPIGAGDTVNVLQGTDTVGTGTTSSSGCCTVTIPSAGSRTVQVIDPNFGTKTFDDVSLTCGGKTTVSLGGEPTNGTCCDNCIFPDTLFVTDAFQTATLTFNGTRWLGCYVINSLTPGFSDCDCTGTAGTSSTLVTYGVQCNGPQITVSRGISTCNVGNNYCFGDLDLPGCTVCSSEGTCDQSVACGSDSDPVNISPCGDFSVSVPMPPMIIEGRCALDPGLGDSVSVFT